MKQEKLEVAIKNSTLSDENKELFIMNSKTIHKRMYSEEDMLKMLQKFGFDYTYNYKGEKSIYERIPEWFEEYKRLEQFKNK